MKATSQPVKRKQNYAFTLVGLFVVVSFVGLLAGLITLMVPRAIETAKKVKAKGDMLAIVAAIKAYKWSMVFTLDHRPSGLLTPSHRKIGGGGLALGVVV